jgi:hypothetical protein
MEEDEEDLMVVVVEEVLEEEIEIEKDQEIMIEDKEMAEIGVEIGVEIGEETEGEIEVEIALKDVSTVDRMVISHDNALNVIQTVFSKERKIWWRWRWKRF